MRYRDSVDKQIERRKLTIKYRRFFGDSGGSGDSLEFRDGRRDAEDIRYAQE